VIPVPVSNYVTKKGCVQGCDGKKPARSAPAKLAFVDARVPSSHLSIFTVDEAMYLGVYKSTQQQPE
jgi:hypothetical protein